MSILFGSSSIEAAGYSMDRMQLEHATKGEAQHICDHVNIQLRCVDEHA